MAPEERKNLVRRAFEDLGRGNPSTLLDSFADDVHYQVIGNTVFSVPVHGRDELITRLFAPLSEHLATPLQLAVRNLFADGDCVVVQAHGRATLRSGAAYNNTYCFVLRFEGDRVVEVEEYLDTALVNRAFSVPSDRLRLLRQMDLNMWEMFREIVRLARGSELFETQQYFMAWSPSGTHFHNMVMIRDSIDPDVLFAAIRKQYVERDRTFSIWTRQHADSDLERVLQQRGFNQFSTMPGMALLCDPGGEHVPAGLEIRAATSDQHRRDYLSITAEAYATYGAPRAYAEDAFVSIESVCAPHIQGFLGYVGGRPVAGATVYVTHGVAGIGWVGTVPDQRGRGYGEAVTRVAIREGFRRGGVFANLQASPMGRPIYERMGFFTATEYRVWVGPV